MPTYELLAAPPPAGTLEEVLFGGDGGTHTWVRFSGSGESWLGVFQNGGVADKRKVFVFADQAVVLAEGILYVLSLTARKVLFVSDKSGFQDVIADDCAIVTAAMTTIHVFDYAGPLKIIQGYYFDLFAFQTITDQEVYAHYCQFGGDWTGLTIDRATWQILGKPLASS